MLILLSFFLAVTTFRPFYCSKTSKTVELYDDLQANISSNIRPGLDNEGPVIVNITFNLVALTELNELKGYISTIGFFDVTWIDERATWDTENYEGVSEITVDSQNTWTPRVVFSNSADRIYSFQDTPSVVRYFSDGFAFWRPGSVSKTICYIQIPAYPFDVHTCNISLNTWGTFTSEVFLATPFDTVIIAYYSQNSEWAITGTSVYSLNDMTETSVLSFRIQFSRKSAFLLVNVLIPIVFLSVLNSFSFLLPQESGERVSFSVTVLLSFTVFLNVIGDNIPKTSSPMPLICHYVMIVLVTSGIITMSAILSQRLCHNRGQEPVPKWIEIVLCLTPRYRQNKIANFPRNEHDSNLKEGENLTVLQTIPVDWRRAIRKLDKILFVVFFIFAIVLAIAFIFYMAKVQSEEGIV